MSILRKLFSKNPPPKLPQRLALQESSPTTIDSIFKYLTDQVGKTRNMQELLADYDNVRKLPSDQREFSFIKTYFAFEEFLVTQKPPVTTKQFTHQSLREEIGKSLNLAGLSPYFKLIFLPPPLQTFLICNLNLKSIIKYFLYNLGTIRLHNLVARSVRGTLLESSKFTEDEGFEVEDIIRIQHPETQDITQAFKLIYQEIFNSLTLTVGEKKPVQLYLETYNFVKTLYSFDIISIFLDILPKNPAFETEKLTLLSRGDLENQIRERTRELSFAKEQLERKIGQVESQNQTLEQTKKAMLNLLEDSKELELKLKEERDRAQAIISSMGESILVVDKDFKITMINDAAAKLLEVSKDYALGKTWSDLVSAHVGNQKISHSERSFTIAMTEKRLVITKMESNHYYQTKSGRKFPVTAITTPLFGNGVIGAVKVFRDVTHEKYEKEIIEKKVEEQTKTIKEDQAKFIAALDSLPRGFIIVDTNGKIMVENESISKIFEKEKKKWTLEELAQEMEGSFDLVANYKLCLVEKLPIHKPEFNLKSKILRIYLAPVFLDENHQDLSGILILIDDITEAKILERSKDEFFSIASHELRTPLTAIRGNTALIKEYYSDKIVDKEFKEMIDDINQSTIRLIDIVNDFLNISRLEQKRMQYKNSDFDISELIEESIKEFQATGSQKKLYLKFENAKVQLPKVFADRDKTKEIILNLVGNSIKFTEEGGITISTQLLPGFLKILITDTGRGIDEKNQSLLFHKFQQAGDSIYTRDATKGTGLGLYISKMMIEGMKGQIGLERSEINKGSTFYFTLPLAQPASKNTKEEQISPYGFKGES